MRHAQFFITPDGHVACKGLTLMTGYWEDEEATRRVLQDGVVTTATWVSLMMRAFAPAG